MLTVSNIMEKLDQLAPRAAACDWDNPGLLVGRSNKEVARVYVALDATYDVVSRAIESDCDLIITHHPVIFKGIKAINDNSALGSKLLDLIQNDVSAFSMHTNYDSCPGGMGDMVCDTLGLKKLCSMEPTGYTPLDKENGSPNGIKPHTAEPDTVNGIKADMTEYGIGFIAKLPHAMSCKELSEMIKDKFDLPFIRFYDAGTPITTIACCPGSGRGELREVMNHHVDAFISGDMGHHEGLDLNEEGISLIDAGHYGLEHIFVNHVSDFIEEHFPDVEIIKDQIHYPVRAL
ncbi:Nif3-like dinuclear metal center hexameric protein [Oribacterium sp. WCC10]|uniref:Nif3-like dinuclear metal center hexameric protein n=1 Tax=Oribacterium sp. WCC10 TaxID=1855343 RepID=UPI0008E6A297|nr:Nif3-like dinuclear metal center hexameric protein [Oribacterium sp. WCC10]SFG41535.1 dinuclear metal center protein, YbgI/SA1388 family [Oribacterium sp. WCC10]